MCLGFGIENGYRGDRVGIIRIFVPKRNLYLDFRHNVAESYAYDIFIRIRRNVVRIPKIVACLELCVGGLVI